jgi:hypothetical protein
MPIAPQESLRLQLGPRSSGAPLTPSQFDTAEFEEGWRSELVRGVLIVSPRPCAKSAIRTRSWDAG